MNLSIEIIVLSALLVVIVLLIGFISYFVYKLNPFQKEEDERED